MYFYKIMNTLLKGESKELNKVQELTTQSLEPVNEGMVKNTTKDTTQNIKKVSNIPEQDVVNSSQSKLEKPKKEKETNNSLVKAYSLFSNSGQSFLAFLNNQKVNVFLNGIEHPEKNDPTSKKANQFINDNIKKKHVYLKVVKQLESGDVLADVYLDAQGKECLNQLLIENELHKTKSIPVNKEELKNITTPTEKNKSKGLTGYLVDYGAAPYLKKEGNKPSFYIELNTESGKEVKWGVDFENAIERSNAKLGDYINVTKEGTELVNGKTLNLWKIKILKEAQTIPTQVDGPPIEESDIPVENDVDYGYQEPIDWNLVQEDEYNEEDMSNRTPPAYLYDDAPLDDWADTNSSLSEPPPYEFPENTTPIKPKI